MKTCLPSLSLLLLLTAALLFSSCRKGSEPNPEPSVTAKDTSYVLTSFISASGKSYRYEYNAQGNLSRVIKNDGTDFTQYDYGVDGQVIGVHHKDGTINAGWNLFYENGKLSKIMNETDTIVIEYNSKGLRSAVKQTFPNKKISNLYTYDADDNLTTVIINDSGAGSTALSIEYDKAIKNPAATLSGTFMYWKDPYGVKNGITVSIPVQKYAIKQINDLTFTYTSKGDTIERKGSDGSKVTFVLEKKIEG